MNCVFLDSIFRIPEGCFTEILNYVAYQHHPDAITRHSWPESKQCEQHRYDCGPALARYCTLTKSVAQWKTELTPFLTHLGYCSFALSHGNTLCSVPEWYCRDSQARQSGSEAEGRCQVDMCDQRSGEFWRRVLSVDDRGIQLSALRVFGEFEK